MQQPSLVFNTLPFHCLHLFPFPSTSFTSLQHFSFYCFYPFTSKHTPSSFTNILQLSTLSSFMFYFPLLSPLLSLPISPTPSPTSSNLQQSSFSSPLAPSPPFLARRAPRPIYTPSPNLHKVASVHLLLCYSRTSPLFRSSLVFLSSRARLLEHWVVVVPLASPDTTTTTTHLPSFLRLSPPLFPSQPVSLSVLSACLRRKKSHSQNITTGYDTYQ